MVINQHRTTSIGNALANLGYDGITAFDRTEPEYSTLETLYDRFESEAYTKLIGILAASQDYALNGSAQDFWAQLNDTAAGYETLDSTQAVRELMGDFMDTNVNATKRDQKRRRLVYLLDSGFDDWFVDNHNQVEPLVVWKKLANGLNSQQTSQTVVLAMKIYDVAHLVIHNEYLEFNSQIPVPPNRQIKRVAQTSGIVDSKQGDDIIDAWAAVIEKTSEELDQSLSLLRIDSIVFQAGQIIGQHEADAENAQVALAEYFESVLLEPNRGNKLARELIHAL